MVRVNLVVDRYAEVDGRSLRSKIAKHGVKISKRKYDYTIIVGGDGAFLNSALAYIEKPILHIRKRTRERISLGRLSSGDIGEIDKVLEKLKSGRFVIRKEPVLLAKYNGRRYRSVGDFFIERGRVKQAARYRYVIKDGRRSIRGFAISNGIIITTPIGSTGYYSYMERLRHSNPKRIRGIGFAHILPAYIHEVSNGKEEKYAVKRVLGKGAEISVVFTRDAQQYLYGVPEVDRGIRISPRKKMTFRIGEEKLRYIVLD